MISNVKREFMYEISSSRFMDIDDLYKKKEKIKENFALFDDVTKEMYKWYFFYQLCLIRDNKVKSEMWYYVCGENNEEMLDIRYNAFCDKREKLMKRNIKKTNI